MDFSTFNFKNNQLIIGIAVVVGVLIVGASGYFYYQSQKGQSQTDSQMGAEEQSKKVVEEVSKIMDLPQNEQPTVATITDINALANQPFFAHAKNGDKVLLYPQNKKAILYDPQAKKIVEASPFNVGTPSAEVAGEATPSASPK